MQAGRVTISSAVADHTLPSFIFASAAICCVSPSRMRVDTQAWPQRGPSWKRG